MQWGRFCLLCPISIPGMLLWRLLFPELLLTLCIFFVGLTYCEGVEEASTPIEKILMMPNIFRLIIRSFIVFFWVLLSSAIVFLSLEFFAWNLMKSLCIKLQVLIGLHPLSVRQSQPQLCFSPFWTDMLLLWRNTNTKTYFTGFATLSPKERFHISLNDLPVSPLFPAFLISEQLHSLSWSFYTVF